MTEPLRILLVEDDEVDRSAVRRGLKSVGLAFRLDEVGDVSAAVAALKESVFDCAILDYQLPDGDSFGVLSRLDEFGPGCPPFVVLTGLDDEELGLRLLAAGAQDYLVKGRVSGDGLRRSIRYAMERKRAQKAIGASERRYRQLFENSLGLICAHDLGGQLLSVNPAAAQALGYPPEDVSSAIGRSLRDFIAPAFGDRFDGYLATIRRDGASSGHLHMLPRTGEERIWRYRNVLLDEPGQPPYVIGFAQDVTEERRSRDALKASEERYRELVENATDIIYRVDTAGRITYANPFTARLLGFSEDEILGRNYLDLVHPDWREDVREFYVSAYRNLVPTTSRELPVVTKEGREIWLACSTQLLFEDGVPVGFQSINRDITEGKKAAERLRRVVEAAPNAMIIVGKDGRIALANAEVETLFGYTRAELLGQPIEVLVPERLRADHTQHRNGFFAAPQARAMGARRDLFGLRKDGTEVPVEIGLNPIETPEGLSTLASIIDITERKRLEELREDLTGTMVHDLRSPLAAILGALEFVGSSDRLTGQQTELIEIAQHNVQRLLDLINAILDISRLEQGAMPIERQPLRLAELVTEVLNLDAPLARDKGLVLVSTVPGELEAWADREVLRRVLQNLLGNSLKFTPPGGAIRVHAAAEGGMLRVAVSDTGAGIGDDIRERLFEKFASGRSPGRGSGLGLAFCRLAVEAHGGSIRVDSPPGQGATFIFTLPIHTGDPA